MTGIREYGRYLQRFSMERYLLTEDTSNRSSSRVSSIKVFNSFMDLKQEWRINWCPYGITLCWEKGISSSALINFLRTKLTSYTHDTDPYITLWWIYVLPSLHIAFLKINQKRYLSIRRAQGNWSCLHTKLIPNWRRRMFSMRKDEFITAFDKWCDKWKEFLNERTLLISGKTTLKGLERQDVLLRHIWHGSIRVRSIRIYKYLIQQTCWKDLTHNLKEHCIIIMDWMKLIKRSL